MAISSPAIQQNGAADSGSEPAGGNSNNNNKNLHISHITRAGYT
jgi:hypothetical protein